MSDLLGSTPLRQSRFGFVTKMRGNLKKTSFFPESGLSGLEFSKGRLDINLELPDKFTGKSGFAGAFELLYP